MGSIFGVAKKGFGMLKKSKDSSKLLKRRQELGRLKDATKVDWEAFKRANRPEPARPGTEKAKQKIAADWVKMRKRTKDSWKKKKIEPMEKAKGGAVKKTRPGGYGPTNPPKMKVDELDRHPPKTTTHPKAGLGRPGARAHKKSGPHDRHPPKRKGMGPAGGYVRPKKATGGMLSMMGKLSKIDKESRRKLNPHQDAPWGFFRDRIDNPRKKKDSPHPRDHHPSKKRKKK